jgi:hypothetical protein
MHFKLLTRLKVPSTLGFTSGHKIFVDFYRSTMSESTSITPTFRGEFYFLIAKFLEDGPCKEAAELLRKQVN